MYKNVDALGVVKGVTVYKCHDGVPDQFPLIADTGSISLPQITFPTFSQQMMGDTDVVDQSRVNPMVTGITGELSIIQSELHGYGIQEYLCKWAQQMKKEDGTFKVVGFTAFIAGIPSEDFGSTVQVGEGTQATMNIATLKYRLVCDGEELRNVDKTLGILKINGVNYREEVNKLL